MLLWCGAGGFLSSTRLRHLLSCPQLLLVSEHMHRECLVQLCWTQVASRQGAVHPHRLILVPPWRPRIRSRERLRLHRCCWTRFSTQSAAAIRDALGVTVVAADAEAAFLSSSAGMRPKCEADTCALCMLLPPSLSSLLGVQMEAKERFA